MGTASVQVRLLLEGGHSETVELPSQAPELERLFHVLGLRQRGESAGSDAFFQLPLNGGTESLTFNASELVAISTRPPVLVEFEQAVPPASPAPAPAPAAVALHRPQVVVLDDFLGPYECADMLAYALQQEALFRAGTVTTGPESERQNLAILDFAGHPHSKLVCNRLLTWFPSLLRKLAIDPFPVHQVESQLTASNHGHYYRAHLDRDSASEIERVLTCVYYFSKQPTQFAGGALRIYDAWREDATGANHAMAETYQEIAPTPNRMVVFPSDSYHELMPIRCPSRRFADSRFAITNWIWRHADTSADARHGWGHMHCGRMPGQWQAHEDAMA